MLNIGSGGRMSMSVLSPRFQIVNGLPDSPKTEAKGALLVRMRPQVPPGCVLISTGPSLSQVRSCAGFAIVFVLVL